MASDGTTEAKKNIQVFGSNRQILEWITFIIIVIHYKVLHTPWWHETSETPSIIAPKASAVCSTRTQKTERTKPAVDAVQPCCWKIKFGLAVWCHETVSYHQVIIPTFTVILKTNPKKMKYTQQELNKFQNTQRKQLKKCRDCAKVQWRPSRKPMKTRFYIAFPTLKANQFASKSCSDVIKSWWYRNFQCCSGTKKGTTRNPTHRVGTHYICEKFPWVVQGLWQEFSFRSRKKNAKRKI